MNKVGIAIINYNSTEYLDLTLESVFNSKNETDYVIGIIDNGSNLNEKKKCKNVVEKYTKINGRNILYIDSDKNLGFSGGNNELIKRLLEDESITHICLLNSDVIVPNGWLDTLLKYNKDVIGPVTNAAGNEQTIQADYSNTTKSEIFDLVNGFSEKRINTYKDYSVKTDLVTFFATIIARKVIDDVGFLDERFYPGSYEDDDYCMRILEKGYEIFIARDCYVHHYGSGSFSKIEMNDRKSIGNINRKRYEEKWNCKWEDRTWKLLKSCEQDISYLLNGRATDWDCNQINTSLLELEKLLKDWGEAIQFFTSEKEDQLPAEMVSGKKLLKILIERARVRVKEKLSNYVKRVRKIFNKTSCNEARYVIDDIRKMIMRAKEDNINCICVFAPMFNKENEKDGYIQRIKAIDNTVFEDMCRIYVYDEGVDCKKMRIDIIDNLHGYIVFNSHDAEQLECIKMLVKTIGRIYIHSILRFIEDRSSRKMWDILDDVDVLKFWDVHGVVPEEYELSGSDVGAKIANNIEKIFSEKVDYVVVVTEAMGRFLKRKYPEMSAEVVTVPILNKELLTPSEIKKEEKDRYTITYAGGTQPWQNIGLMKKIISQTIDKYDYRIFVPSVDEFIKCEKIYNIEGASISSKSTEELYKEYEKCDFGFVLRDDSPVNYVACPTKIIEYLKYGIIPIMKSTEIGDFVNMGMKYISYEQVVDGKVLSGKERADYIKQNYKVINKLMEVYQKGIKQLKDYVGSDVRVIRRKADEKTAIGLVVTTFDKGGLEQVVLNLYNGYLNQGYDVYLLCQENILGDMAKQIASENILVFNNDLGTFIKYLYRYNISILHYHYNIFGWKEAKCRGVKLLYTMHNVYTWKNDAEIKDYSSVLNNFDCIIPVSNLVKNYFISRSGMSDEKYKVIYNGIDFDELAEVELPEELSRESFGIKSDDVVIAFVASFYPVKYQIGMIGVMEKLKSIIPNAKLLFVGNHDNEYFERFEKVYKESSAKDNMIIVPYFSHKYMGAFLRQVVDIFTLPTLQEGCSNAVLEAIYCDKPLVITKVGNALDVSDMQSCRVVNTAYKDILTTTNEDMIKISERKHSPNEDDLVDAYKEVIENIDTYKKNAIQNSDKKAQYETANMVKKYVEIIEKLM